MVDLLVTYTMSILWGPPQRSGQTGYEVVSLDDRNE